ncbi:MAG: hypothetical protein ACI9EW_001421 [Cellvibrionaceae bacterium]|jgi:hypothetical protein
MSDMTEIGRVLRASTAGFAIGSRVNQLDAPAFGCLVVAEPIGNREAIFGLIYDMHINDDQLIQRLVMTEDPRPEIIEDQRKNRMLPLEMSVLTLGYRANGNIRQGLPPRPPLNLDPVRLCSDDEIQEFTAKLNYLRMIQNNPSVRIPVDQLLQAHIMNVFARRGEDKVWALAAVREVIELLRGNYDMLMPTLEGLSAALPELDF